MAAIAVVVAIAIVIAIVVAFDSDCDSDSDYDRFITLHLISFPNSVLISFPNSVWGRFCSRNSVSAQGQTEFGEQIGSQTGGLGTSKVINITI